MHSRTYLLLEREYLELQEANLYGISATPVSDNFLEWIAKVQGLKDSLWEGAILQLSMKYNEKYNQIPPSITFHTIPFHPNVSDSSGKPCIDFLDNLEDWNARFTMSSILLTIQAMLSNPVLENAVNTEAVEMLKNNPAQYRKFIFDCVRTSRELEAGVIEDNNVERIQLLDRESFTTHQRKIKNISFEDYHKTWSEIATSQAGEELKNPLFKDPVFQRDYYEFKKNKNDEADPHEMKVHSAVIHGVFTKPQRAKEKVDENLTRVNKVRQTYLLQNASDKRTLLSPPMSIHLEPSLRDKEEPSEEEVNSLVNWTNNLSTDALDD